MEKKKRLVYTVPDGFVHVGDSFIQISRVDFVTVIDDKSIEVKVGSCTFTIEGRQACFGFLKVLGFNVTK